LLKPERLLQQWKILASTAWAIRPAAATSFRPVSQVTDVLKGSRSLSNVALTRSAALESVHATVNAINAELRVKPEEIHADF
jgi:hypothetical protein